MKINQRIFLMALAILFSFVTYRVSHAAVELEKKPVTVIDCDTCGDKDCTCKDCGKKSKKKNKACCKSMAKMESERKGCGSSEGAKPGCCSHKKKAESPVEKNQAPSDK